MDIGCSLAEINEMTLHDIRRLSEYSKKNPPLRVLVQACAVSLGFKLPEPDDGKNKKYMTAEEFKQFVQTTGGRVPGMGFNG